ncbi:MAG: CUAEP/CCAEP-tail radical SAM protein [Vicinamibacterales bacterium]
MRVLLVATYDLGRQPFGLASPAAWLREDGFDVDMCDVSRTPLDWDAVGRADAVAWFLPMHTATRLALPLMRRVRGARPGVLQIAYGLYATSSASTLAAEGVTPIEGGEFEESLRRVLRLARSRSPHLGAEGPANGVTAARPSIPRLTFRVPDRHGLPPLARYARLRLHEGDRIVGYTEASRGCKHACRHCPIVPVYDGQFRVIPVDVVREDVRAQVEQGARHITFGDPDFFNGIGHARRVVSMMRDQFAGVGFDVTIKVSHLLQHADELPTLARAGCLFVTSAVESVDDRVLERLDKGHTRGMFVAAVSHTRAAGLALAPTFVPFTPWTSLDGYADLLETIDSLDLVDHVAPIQWAIRLLLPSGSRLLDLADVAALVGPFDAERLVHPWSHPDPRVDQLCAEILDVVGHRIDSDRRAVFGEIAAVVDRARNREAIRSILETAAPRQAVELEDEPRRSRAAVPYLTEPWYC